MTDGRGLTKLRLFTAVLGAAALAASAVSAPAAATPARPLARSNGRIAYSVGAVLPDPDPDAKSQVFTVNPDGSDVRQLTHVAAPGEAGDPNFSPDGTRLAYVSNTSGRFQLWVMNADGSHQRRLLADPGHDAFVPQWAPDGRHLVYTRCRYSPGTNLFPPVLECAIATVRTDGTDDRDITSGHWIDFDATYSPDGRSVVFAGYRGGLLSAIWRTSASGGRLHRLTAAEPEAFWPDYAPDGRTILFSNNFDRPASRVFSMRPDGSHITQVTHVGPDDQAGFASYAPDGKKIVLDYYTPSTGDSLAVANADGTHLTPIVATGDLTLADWGPTP